MEPRSGNSSETSRRQSRRPAQPDAERTAHFPGERVLIDALPGGRDLQAWLGNGEERRLRQCAQWDGTGTYSEVPVVELRTQEDIVRQIVETAIAS